MVQQDGRVDPATEEVESVSRVSHRSDVNFIVLFKLVYLVKD